MGKKKKCQKCKYGCFGIVTSVGHSKCRCDCHTKTKKLSNLLFGGGAGHDCKSNCISCNTAHALEVLVWYVFRGRFPKSKKYPKISIRFPKLKKEGD